MKNLYTVRLIIPFLFTLLTSVSGFTNSINGTWVNIDSETRGLTKAVISESSKLRLWAACSKNECHLGETPIWDGGDCYKAMVKQKIATRKMKIFVPDQANLRIVVRTEYNDERLPQIDIFYFKKVFSLEKEDGGSIIVYNKPEAENCTQIDFTTAKINTNGKEFELVSGNENPTSFFGFGSKKRKAISALEVIQKYEVTQTCNIGPMQYLLTSRGALRGEIEGADCTSFKLNNLKIKKLNGKYKITSDNLVILDFGRNQSDAKAGLKVLKKYGFRNLCYVSRSAPTFMYFKK